MHGSPTTEETTFDARAQSDTYALWTLAVSLWASSLLYLSEAPGGAGSKPPQRGETSRARVCVTVARQDIEKAHGRSVATSLARICVTVARPDGAGSRQEPERNASTQEVQAQWR